MRKKVWKADVSTCFNLTSVIKHNISPFYTQNDAMPITDWSPACRIFLDWWIPALPSNCINQTTTNKTKITATGFGHPSKLTGTTLIVFTPHSSHIYSLKIQILFLTNLVNKWYLILLSDDYYSPFYTKLYPIQKKVFEYTPCQENVHPS